MHRTGKWIDPSVPPVGWVCISVFDAGKNNWRTCEMCEVQRIRFGHVTKHDKYPSQLIVGSECVKHMTDDDESALRRDQFMRSRASRRSRWVCHRSWKVSWKGNEYIKQGPVLVIALNKRSHERRDGLWVPTLKWFALIKYAGEQFFTDGFETEDEAKLAAFDRVTILLARDLQGFDD